MEPLNVSREDFPMSTVTADGMIPMQPRLDNYEIYYKEDEPYQERNGRILRLQIIGPIDAPGDIPCIVFIPGSAFHEQNVKERVPQLSYLAQKGFVVAALEYRGSECAVFPAQALDAKAGVDFMKKHASEYGIHPEKIVLMGDSSGGHTAVIVAFSYGIEELEETDRRSNKPIVKGVIDLYGPVNFATMNEEPSSQDHRTPDSPEGCEIGGKPVLEHPELVRPATIANYVQEDRELPPILMFHGTNDELVPFGQSCQLYEALTAAKKDAVFYQVIGAHHGGREFWTKEVLDIEERFIRKVCED
ncbi:MAG: alpha/beta hydrolase [Lachnospiraceae bacterium]|nr:alpha/beta hydrolase [Lachnospiraceae bacterium]